ncbi:division plane positioning ATPase MipZ [Woodsholea maritima]|uniref:division plane positioning ATPase MipZ n=1 Tax=Woodsholea maritima TaxID=240237 RepID=UPI0005936372|nr:division plane positioning ATPase MipZ [Woodsholea maritima]
MSDVTSLTAPEEAKKVEERARNTTAHVIIVGNEKGGAGKSTVAIHLAVALTRMGKKVGMVDLDLRQGTLSKYLNNRKKWCEKFNVTLPNPLVHKIEPSVARHLDEIEADESARWAHAVDTLTEAGCDFIIADSPGSDNYLARTAHGYADTIITPVNDSFVDFALLGEVDPDTFEVSRPSQYSEMVWECRKRKAIFQKKTLDWVVMRNRVAMLDSRNKRRVGDGLKKLSERVGFRLAPGFAERVIYRELFPLGLTLLDLTEHGSTVQFTMSHVAARQELRDLIMLLKFPSLAGQKIQF